MKLPRIVYALRHDATGKLYIGSTANIDQRLFKHANRLKNGTHNSKRLQADYNRHENKGLTIIQLDTIDTYADRNKEYEWVAVYDTCNPEHGYNYADPKLSASPSHNKLRRG